MNRRTRRKREILRDRRRGWLTRGITPAFAPLTGYELFLIHKYGTPQGR